MTGIPLNPAPAESQKSSQYSLSEISALDAENRQRESDRINLVKEFGVPQGTATACSLATLAVEPLTVEREDVVMYADDGLTFSEEAWNFLNSEELQARGVHKEESKSKILKKKGKWQVHSFRFLGLRYYPAYFSTTRVVQRRRMLKYLRSCKGVYGLLTPLKMVSKLWMLHLIPHIQAETRNGSKLAMSLRHHFLL
jgi:hypothetical protein